MAQQQSHDYRRHRGDDQLAPRGSRFPTQFGVGGKGIPRQRDPRRAEGDQQRDQGAPVQCHIEPQTGIVPAQQAWDNKEVSAARDGQEFGDALYGSEHNGLKDIHWSER